MAEQYELREKQMEKINEQISLETQLNEAKMAKAQMEKTIEKEISLKYVDFHMDFFLFLLIDFYCFPI